MLLALMLSKRLPRRRSAADRGDVLGRVLFLRCLLNRRTSESYVAALGFQKLANEATGALAENFPSPCEIFALGDGGIKRRGCARGVSL